MVSSADHRLTSRQSWAATKTPLSERQSQEGPWDWLPQLQSSKRFISTNLPNKYHVGPGYPRERPKNFLAVLGPGLVLTNPSCKTAAPPALKNNLGQAVCNKECCKHLEVFSELVPASSHLPVLVRALGWVEKGKLWTQAVWDHPPHPDSNSRWRLETSYVNCSGLYFFMKKKLHIFVNACFSEEPQMSAWHMLSSLLPHRIWPALNLDVQYIW